MQKKKLIASVAALASVATILVSGASANAATSISGKGSSFAANAISYCAAHYDPASGDTVTYTSTGSGTGRSEFAAGNVQFAVTDAPYTSGFPTSRYVNVPLFGGPVVFAYNKTARKIPAGLKLDAKIVSGILKGTIRTWDDAAIKKINVGKVLPHKFINVYYRTSGSGTTTNLTTYLAANAGAGWLSGNKDLMAAAGGKLATGAKAKATSAVIADMVEADPYGFGYFDLSDAASANVNSALLKNANGEYVAPTSSAAVKFLAAQGLTKDATNTLAGDATDGILTIDFAKKVAGGYQLSIVTYGLAPRGTATSGSAFAVKGFFKYVLSTCMPSYAASHGYVAFVGSLKTKALTQANAIG